MEASASASSPDAHPSSDDATTLAGPPPPRAAPRRKKRRSTSQIRKEEMSALQDEIVALRRQLRQASARSSPVTPRELRAKVDANHITLAGAQSMLSAFTGSCWPSPFSTPICLPVGAAQRRDYLAAMYEDKTQLATRLLLERTRFLDLRKEHAHVERFEMASGDFVVTRFEIAPFGRAFSVKRIFDEMVQFTSQVEMSITDHAGVVSVVEQDDAPSSCVRQSRIVTAVGDGIDVETNFVLFTKFSERESRGVLAFDCVNDDERWARHETLGRRLHCEVAGGGLVVACPTGDVSMARWMSVCIRKPALPLTGPEEILVRENARAIGDVMVKAMQEKLGLR